MSKFIKLTTAKDHAKFIVATDLIASIDPRGAESKVIYKDGERGDVKEDLDTIYSMLEPQKSEAIDPDKPLVSSDEKTYTQWMECARELEGCSARITISGKTLRQLLELIK
mgnify:CR=1 FL=1